MYIHVFKRDPNASLICRETFSSGLLENDYWNFLINNQQEVVFIEDANLIVNKNAAN